MSGKEKTLKKVTKTVAVSKYERPGFSSRPFSYF
jgi:hypothetical protein